jgi:S1-C subfamily serine protease
VDYPTSVSRTLPINMRASGTPRYRDANVEGIELTDAMPSLGGVLADKKGRVVAGWFSFLDQAEDERTFYGLSAAYITPLLDTLRQGQRPEVRSLGAEFWPVSLAEGRDRGLTDDRAILLMAEDPTQRQVLAVSRVSGNTPASDRLREADLLLSLNGRTVTRMLAIEEASRAAEASLVVLRDGKEVEVGLPTVPLPTLGVERVLSWAGLTLHDAHYEVEHQYGRPMPGVYIAWLWYGTPGSRYDLRPTRRIVEVDGKPTPNLDALLDIVRGMEDRQAVRVQLASLDGKIYVRTLKLDTLYWPTQIIERQQGRWVRRSVDAP